MNQESDIFSDGKPFEFVRTLLATELSRLVGVHFSEHLLEQQVKSDEAAALLSKIFGSMKVNETPNQIQEVIAAINILASQPPVETKEDYDEL